VVAVPLAVALMQGNGLPEQRVAMSGGGAWLASPAQGVVTLIDGPSDQVVAAVRLPAASAVAATSVTQSGTSAYVVDDQAGTVSRVDGSTYEVAAPIGFGVAGGSLSVFSGSAATYVVDGARRLASVTDPRTLAVRNTLSLTARPGAGQSLVDDAGRLWVLDSETGELAWFERGREHLRAGVGAAGDQLLQVRGRAVLADPARARVGPLAADGTVSDWSCLGVRPSDRTQLLGSATSDQVYAAVQETGTLLIAKLDGRSDDCTEVVPVGSPGTDFGPLVQVGGFVLVPDRTTGKTVIVDVDGARVADDFSVVQAGHPLELLAKDGLVFYNDPASDRAGVIHFDGRTWTLGKSLQKFRLGKGGVPITNAVGAGAGPTSSPPTATASTPTGPVAQTSGVPLPVPPTGLPLATGSVPPGTDSGPTTGASSTPSPTASPTLTGDPSCGSPPSGSVAGKSAQKIVFPAFGSHVWPKNSATIAACSTSGLPVTLTLDTQSFCALSGKKLTAALPTTCQVTASQPGDAQYAAAAPVSRTLTVGQQHVTFSWLVGPPAQVRVSTVLTLKVKASSPSGPVADTPVRVVVRESVSDVCSGPGSADLTNGTATFQIIFSDIGTCTIVVAGPAGDNRTTVFGSTPERSAEVVIPAATDQPTTGPPSLPPGTQNPTPSTSQTTPEIG
jgi:hypothetical protein